jgi:hypothetical protein
VTEHYLEFDSYPKHVPRQSCRARLFRGRWHNYRCHRGNPKRLVRRLPSRRTRANRLRHLTPVRGLIFVPLQRLTLVWFSRNAANLLLGDLFLLQLNNATNRSKIVVQLICPLRHLADAETVLGNVCFRAQIDIGGPILNLCK